MALIDILKPIDEKISNLILKILEFIKSKKDDYKDIISKYDFYTNIILFVILLTYIFVQLLLMLFNKYYIMGWLFLFIIFWPIIFTAKIVLSLDTFLDKKDIYLKKNDKGVIEIKFIKTFISFIYNILTNIGNLIPFILINSLLYTFLKVLPFDKNYINAIYILLGFLFVIFLILISFLRNVFKKSGAILAKSILYLISTILLLFIIIELLSKFFDIFLNKLLITKEQYAKYADDLVNKYLILQDLRHEEFIDVFQYFMYMLFLIIVFIISFISIFLFHTKCNLNLCKDDNGILDENYFTNNVNKNMTKLLNKIFLKLNINDLCFHTEDLNIKKEK